MASKILLIISFVAIANGNAQSHYDQVQAYHAQVRAQIEAQAQAMAQAHSQSMANAFGRSYNNEGKYVWVPNDDDNEESASSGFRKTPAPPVPPPPPIYVPDFGQGFQHFPHHHSFNFDPVVNIPSAGDIKNIKPASGQFFNGVSVRSSSGFGKDKDGKAIRTGGTTVVTNDNGDVEETKVGKNPPNIEDPIVFPSPQFVVPKMPDPVTFKPFKSKPYVFKPFTFEPITFKPIDVNYVPAKGENYVAVSTSSHSESSNINGVKTSSGGSHDAVNINGAVDQEAVEFRQGDDPDRSEEVLVDDE